MAPTISASELAGRADVLSGLLGLSTRRTVSRRLVAGAILAALFEAGSGRAWGVR
jgi:hypothetical protein